MIIKTNQSKDHKFNLTNETCVIAFLDLTNMFHWQDRLKWNFSVYHVIEQLFGLKSVKEVRIYYGLNTRQWQKSENFHQRLRKTGSIVITKPVKWIRKEITKSLFVKPSTFNLFNGQAQQKLDELIVYLQKQGIVIEEPKCNFDVEMSLDMLDAVNKLSGILLFSGDSDLNEPLERVKLKGINIYIFGVRGLVARELWRVCSKYMDFGQWYCGPKMRKTRKIAGPRV